MTGGGGPGTVVLARRGRIVLHLAFLLSGCATVMLGPLVPALQEAWGIAPGEAASLFLAQFSASAIAAAFVGRRLRHSLVFGYGLTAAALVLLALGPRSAAVPAMALVGWGLGSSVPASNLLVARLYPGGRAAALSALNLVWGLGALTSPLLFAAFEGHASVKAPILVLAVGAAASALALLATIPVLEAPAATPEAPAQPVRLERLALFGVQLFLYEGTEASIGGWVVALAHQTTTAGDVVPLLIGSAFWAAFLGGRALAPALLRHVSEPALTRACLPTAAAGAIALLLAPGTPVLAAGAILAGAGLAPLFPLIVSALAFELGGRPSRAGGTVFAIATMGAAVLPWLTGRVAAATGLVQWGFLVPVVASAALAALLMAERRHRAAPVAPRLVPPAY
jgi:fucose permease